MLTVMGIGALLTFVGFKHYRRSKSWWSIVLMIVGYVLFLVGPFEIERRERAAEEERFQKASETIRHGL